MEGTYRTASASNTVVEGEYSRDVSPTRSGSKARNSVEDMKAENGADGVINPGNKGEDVIVPAPILAEQARGDTIEIVEVQKDNGKKEHWLEKTEMTLPKNNLPVVFTGLMLTVFWQLWIRPSV